MGNISKSQSLAGGSYMDHAWEINKMIDETNRNNAKMSQKSILKKNIK